MDGLNSFKNNVLFKRLTIFITVILIFTFIIDLLKLDNHFYGLNSETGFTDSLYFVSLSFTGMGAGGIYAQTSISRLLMVILSVIKILLIVDVFSLIQKDTDENINKKVNDKLAVLFEHAPIAEALRKLAK